MILQNIADLMDIACKAANTDYKGLKICELGNQLMKWHPLGTGKNYLISKGAIEHISIDMNGKNGALVIDLSKKIDKWNGYFDMVTNYGTAEHVENGIYECYENIHNFTKSGGMMVHAGPITGGCPWHSPYHYDPDFFTKLCSINNYDCIMTEVRVMPVGRKKNVPDKDKSLLCAVIIKKDNSPFCSKESFLNMNAIEGLKHV